MATNTFGEHLKREREMRGVSLDEICAATRISTRFLEALENERWDRLPGGVFNRGFVRAVARFLGLDEENLLAEYALAVSGQPETPAWTGSGAPSAARANWFAWVLTAILLIVLMGGGVVLWRHRAARRASVKTGGLTQATSGSPTGSDPAKDESRGASTTAGSNPPAGGLPANESARLELKIQAGRETTLSVTADGEKVFDGKLDAGSTQQYSAKEKFEVSAGDSSAVLLELNGQVMPPLGNPGEPGKITLTREDLKKGLGGNH